jgi:formate-nitrite transporter family protein
VAAPTPEEIYERTKEEGERRLSRPFLELAATAFVAGADVVFGIIALAITHHLVAARFGPELGQLAGAVAFGVGFVFIVIGRSELFTENFLVPLAGLEARSRASWYKLGELWTLSPIFNLVGGGILILIVTSEGVLPMGTGEAARETALQLDDRDVTAAFLSAVAAGALITLMTWLVEGTESMGIRVLSAWVVGSLLALGLFNHVIVVTLELFFGIRYGADVGYDDLLGNLGLAAVGNLLGGIGLVTLSRFSQARAAQGAP